MLRKIVLSLASICVLSTLSPLCAGDLEDGAASEMQNTGPRVSRQLCRAMLEEPLTTRRLCNKTWFLDQVNYGENFWGSPTSFGLSDEVQNNATLEEGLRYLRRDPESIVEFIGAGMKMHHELDETGQFTDFTFRNTAQYSVTKDRNTIFSFTLCTTS